MGLPHSVVPVENGGGGVQSTTKDNSFNKGTKSSDMVFPIDNSYHFKHYHNIPFCVLQSKRKDLICSVARGAKRKQRPGKTGMVVAAGIRPLSPHQAPCSLSVKKLPSNANLPGSEILLKKVTFSFKFIPLGKPNKHHLMNKETLQGTVIYIDYF
jgi:hypothetical protein